MSKYFFIKSIIFMTELIWKSSVHGAKRHLMHERIYYKLEGKSLIGNVTEVRKVRDFFDCSFVCMKKGVPACLSFNIGRVTDDDGDYVCELSNSERYMEPERMQERISFDYYGITTVMLYSLLPTCDLITCNHGGNCIQGQRLGKITCQCLPEVTVLPFIDDKCNVDTNAMTQLEAVKGVFHAQVGRYTLTFYDAQRLCALLGATLATHDQLYTAWEAGLQKCAYGWLADATLRYPMQTSKPGCRDRIGIIESPTPQDKSTTSNAWCYK